MIDLAGLPLDTRARVNVLTAERQRRRRLGRVEFHLDADTLAATATARGSGELLGSGFVAAVERIGGDAWQLTMDDGALWTVLAGGCGCGG